MSDWDEGRPEEGWYWVRLLSRPGWDPAWVMFATAQARLPGGRFCSLADLQLGPRLTPPIFKHEGGGPPPQQKDHPND